MKLDTQVTDIEVEPELELDKFLECIKTSLKCPDIAKLEKYNEDFESWLPIKKDLELSEGDKFEVTFSVSKEVRVVVILST